MDTGNEYPNFRRYVSLFLSCSNLAMAGTVMTFSNYATDLKHEFRLNQEEVEHIATVSSMGSVLSYPVALFFERMGRACSFCMALLLMGSSCIMVYTTQYMNDFYHRYWGLLAFYLFMQRLASMFLLLVPMAVCFAISSPKHHGFVLGWTGAFYMLGPSVFGSIYAKWFNKYPLGNFFLLVGIFSMILNGLSICFLLPVTDAINQNEDDNENKENETRRVKFYDDDDEKEERWWDRLGLRVITVLPFHLLLWAFAISCGLEQIHFANVSAMAMSYDLVAQAELLPIIGTVSALTAHFVSGWASDKSSKYAPRTVYIVGGQILEALFMIVCIFLGDNAYVLTFSTIIFYTNNGISYTIAPVLIREHFGEKHFARNFGIAVMLAAIFFLGLGAAVGKLYCRHIKDDGNECYGLQCFRDFYILGGVCSMVSVGCCCTLLILEMNRRRLALAEYVEMK